MPIEITIKLGDELATKQDIKELKELISMNVAQAVAALNANTEVLRKVLAEESKLVDEVAKLKEQLANQTGELPEELVTAIQAVIDQTGVLDNVVPDAAPDPVPTPPDPNAPPRNFGGLAT